MNQSISSLPKRRRKIICILCILLIALLLISPVSSAPTRSTRKSKNAINEAINRLHSRESQRRRADRVDNEIPELVDPRPVTQVSETPEELAPKSAEGSQRDPPPFFTVPEDQSAQADSSKVAQNSEGAPEVATESEHEPSVSTPSHDNAESEPIPSQRKTRKSIYEKSARRVRHKHNEDEDKPIGELGSVSESLDVGARGSVYGGHGGHEGGEEAHEQERVAQIKGGEAIPSTPTSSDNTPSPDCLSNEAFDAEKTKAKADLSSIMDHWLAIWQLEGRPEGEIDKLSNSKTSELMIMFRNKKTELQKRLCSSGSPSPVPPTHFTMDQNPTRRLLAVRGQAWAEADAPVKVEFVEDEPLDESEDRAYGASIRPYHAASPSAFTELSESDIASRHEVEETSSDDDDDFGTGFLATITPMRLSPAEKAALENSRGNMMAEIEEEKRRRRERLKARRGIVVASILPATITEAEPAATDIPVEDDDDTRTIGHFVASIKPMAPQHSSPVFEEDQLSESFRFAAKIASQAALKAAKSSTVTAPQASSTAEAKRPSKVQREWMKVDTSKSAKTSEDSSKPTNSRSRLARLVKSASWNQSK